MTRQTWLQEFFDKADASIGHRDTRKLDAGRRPFPSRTA